MSQTGFNPAYQRAVRDQLSTDQCVKGILAGDTHALSYLAHGSQVAIDVPCFFGAASHA